jgi:hypothetical protein
MEDDDLLACPFCGGEAYFCKDASDWEWIECGSCHVATNRSIAIMEDCKPLLVDKWNRRTNANIQQQVQADSSSTTNSLT